MKNPTFVFLMIAVFLFLAGCTIEKNGGYSCCLKGEAKNGKCAFYNDKGPKDDTGIPDFSTKFCDTFKGFCNITISSSKKELEIPICTEREELGCIDGNCTAMVCGSFIYDPIQKLEAFPEITSDEQAKKEALNKENQQTPGLFQKSCLFIPFNTQLQNVFKNNKGGFINSFRFGVGPTFDDYDRSKYLFPISDVACNINDYGTKDRFQNYLPTPEYYLENLNQPNPEYPFDPVKEFDDPLYCVANPEEVKNPEFKMPLDTIYYQGSKGSYKFSQFVIQPQYAGYDNPNNPDTPSTSYVDIDRQFYSKALQFFYWSDISSGKKAPFECETGAECKSGSCSLDSYRRGVCSTEDGLSVNCLCVSGFSKDHKSPYYYLKTNEEIGFCDASTPLAKPSVTVTEGISQTLYDDILAETAENEPLKVPICEYYEQKLTIEGKDETDAKTKALLFFLGCPECKSHPKPITNELKGENKYTLTVQFYNKTCTDYTPKKASYIKFDQPDIDALGGDFTSGIILPNQYMEELAELYKAGTKKSSVKPVIGFSILGVDQFGKSALAKSCNMKNNINYDIVEFEDIFNPIEFHKEELYNLNYEHRYEGTGGAIYSPACIDYDKFGVCSKTHVATAVKYVTLIHDLANCNLDEQGLLPTTKNFGWCEGCTYATMAYQNLTPSKPYSSSYTYIYKVGVPGDPNKLKYVSTSKNDFGYLSNNDPLSSTYPEITYLQKKTTELLENNVLPVIEISADEFWEELKEETKFETYCEIKDEQYTFKEDSPKDLCISLGGQISSTNQVEGTSICSTPSPFSKQYKFQIGSSSSLCTAAEGESKTKQITTKYVNYDSSTGTITLDKEPANLKYLFGKNKGPVIAVVKRLNDHEAANTPVADLQNQIITRSAVVKYYCPKCLVAVVPDSGEQNDKEGYQPGTVIGRHIQDLTKLNIIFGIEGDISDFYPDKGKITCALQQKCNKDVLSLVDLIGYEFYPAEVTKNSYVGSGGFCQYADSAEEYNIFSSDLTDFSYLLLQKYNKPSFVVDFYDGPRFMDPEKPDLPQYIQNPDICHGSVPEDQVYKYQKKMLDNILLNADKLTRAGIIGIIMQYDFVHDSYLLAGGTGKEDKPSMYSPNNCPFEQSARFLTSDKPLSFYYTVYSKPADEALCEKCTELDKLNGICGKLTCSNGNTCTMPEDAEGGPSEYKCGERTIPDKCTQCSDSKFSGKSVSCTQYYEDGTVVPLNVKYDALTDTYADVISSLDAPNRCCLLDSEERTYTYVKVDASGKQDAPVVFSYSGDKTALCGTPAPDDVQNYCGINIPVKNYKITCEQLQTFEVVPQVPGYCTDPETNIAIKCTDFCKKYPSDQKCK